MLWEAILNGRNGPSWSCEARMKKASATDREYTVQRCKHTLIEFAMFLCAIGLFAVIPLIYTLLPVWHFRLIAATALAGGGCSAIWGLYRLTFKRLSGRYPSRGDCRGWWLCWLVALGIAVTAFGALMLAMSFMTDTLNSNTYGAIMAYGTMALSVLVFPLIAPLLYSPLASDGFKQCIKQAFNLLKVHWWKIYIVSIVFGGLNMLQTWLIPNEYVRLALSVILSAMQWTLTIEVYIGCGQDRQREQSDSRYYRFRGRVR